MHYLFGDLWNWVINDTFIWKVRWFLALARWNIKFYVGNWMEDLDIDTRNLTFFGKLLHVLMNVIFSPIVNLLDSGLAKIVDVIFDIKYSNPMHYIVYWIYDLLTMIQMLLDFVMKQLLDVFMQPIGFVMDIVSKPIFNVMDNVIELLH